MGSGYRTGRKKRRERRNKIRRLCKGIVSGCIVFIGGCVLYAAAYTVQKRQPADSQLMGEIEQIMDFYEKERKLVVRETEPDTIIQEVMEREPQTVNNGSDGIELEPAQTAEVESTAGEAADVGIAAISEAEEVSGVEPGRESRLRERFNGAELNPSYPESVDLRNRLDELMPEITADCEDTYDKVKACYDFLIDRCEYSKTVKYSYEQDAYLLLTEFHGSCTYYAAAFHYMMKYIGLDDELVSSYRYVNSGKSFHRWNEITINGTPYLFDTQWEDTLSRRGGVSYSRFGMTHEEVKQYYVFA